MTVRAHPRVCGENASSSGPVSPKTGSSPRVRGKQQEAHDTPQYPRLIPACAGKTRPLFRFLFTRTAHPRVCGENAHLQRSIRSRKGSSPRVRGKLVFASAAVHIDGLIPACAGKTLIRASRGRSRTAHPRVCGENSLIRHSPMQRQGSSPRVRGKHKLTAPRSTTNGLIPACAGKTSTRHNRTCRNRAHPRVCGENLRIPLSRPETAGSSPRVRGKQGIVILPRRFIGLIPACAGKTRRRPHAHRPRRAHPRVCGENRAGFIQTGGEQGSSPRVRGKRRWVAVCRLQRGLIPACAGKTRP